MSELKVYTRKELVVHNTKADAVFVIENKVYDVTKFLDDHPGGHEVLLNVAGKDASEDFDDVGHSSDAKELMKKYLIGELVEEDKTPVKKRHMSWNESADANSRHSFWSSWQFPVVLGLIVTVVYTYFFGL